jgi:hypothetical protein
VDYWGVMKMMGEYEVDSCVMRMMGEYEDVE